MFAAPQRITISRSPLSLHGFTSLVESDTLVNGPAWQASVGDMVPPAALPAAIALQQLGFNIARSAREGKITATNKSFEDDWISAITVRDAS
ncbi:MAG: transporter permease [Sphingomonadales bacterium]|jgi:hypothetical protein|nr:transporter permease [Sphingomonadales bacterium]